MVVKRTRRLSMLIADEEWDMLQSLANARGVTASDWVRMKIRDTFQAEQPKKQKPKR